jgi:hypothetical protein
MQELCSRCKHRLFEKFWYEEACLVILMFLYLFFCVQLFWELNPNKAKPLKFGACRKNNQNVQKTQEEGPWFGHKGPLYCFFLFFFIFPPSLFPFLFSLLVPYIYSNGGGS